MVDAAEEFDFMHFQMLRDKELLNSLPIPQRQCLRATQVLERTKNKQTWVHVTQCKCRLDSLILCGLHQVKCA